MTETFEMIAVQRRAVADVLASLDDEQWATGSLCAGWTIREVAAHLGMPFEVSTRALLWRLIKAKGNFNKVTDDYARAGATGPTARLVAALRDNAEHRFTPPGLGPEAPLTDIVVHGLDIGVPLAHTPPLPSDTANTVLGFLMTPRATRGFLPKDRVPGLHYESTDTGWSAGSGPTVAGPAASLLLTLTGRHAGLQDLSGDGANELARRLA
jgi:uncharacterized protein (TIGR03083 family)